MTINDVPTLTRMRGLAATYERVTALRTNWGYNHTHSLLLEPFYLRASDCLRDFDRRISKGAFASSPLLTARGLLAEKVKSDRAAVWQDRTERDGDIRSAICNSAITIGPLAIESSIRAAIDHGCTVAGAKWTHWPMSRKYNRTVKEETDPSVRRLTDGLMALLLWGPTDRPIYGDRPRGAADLYSHGIWHPWHPKRIVQVPVVFHRDISEWANGHLRDRSELFLRQLVAGLVLSHDNPPSPPWLDFSCARNRATVEDMARCVGVDRVDVAIAFDKEPDATTAAEHAAYLITATAYHLWPVT